MCDDPPDTRGYCAKHYRKMLDGFCDDPNRRRMVQIPGHWREGGSWVRPHLRSIRKRGPRELVPYVPGQQKRLPCKTPNCFTDARCQGLCTSCYNRAYYQIRREELKERNRLYYQAHREQVLAWARNYVEENREQVQSRQNASRRRKRARERELLARGAADTEPGTNTPGTPQDAPALPGSRTGSGARMAAPRRSAHDVSAEPAA